MTTSVAEHVAVTGIVLAGGQSTRFGEPTTNKAIATLGGQPLLERVADTVATATNHPPIVAVRTEAQRAEYAEILAEHDIIFTFDSPDYEGPLAGVVGALETIDTPWVFICGCDMPLLSADAVGWLLTQLEADIDGTWPVVFAVRHSDGTADPLHALYRQSTLSDAVRHCHNVEVFAHY